MPHQDDARRHALLAELVLAGHAGRSPGRDELLSRHPAELVAELLPDGARHTADQGPALHDPTSQAPRTEVGGYRLLSELGRGAQGRVFLAEDTALGRTVALKVLGDGERLLRPDVPTRFRREAEAAARLEHPALCAVHGFGTDGELAWIAMRYVEGQTLADWLSRTGAEGQGAPTLELPVPGDATADTARGRLEHLLAVIESLARALHVAHEAGIVHRDVKPANIMITPEGRPVLLDFGVARDEASTLTATGDVFGTPAYMAPEQLAGDSGAVDHRADVYSLGAVLYECLTLSRPYSAPNREALLRALVQDDPTPLRRLAPGLPRDLEVVAHTALARTPIHRYATALDLAEDLRRVRLREPIRARPAGPFVRLGRWAQRQPLVAASLVLVIASLSTGLVVSHRYFRDADAARAEAEHERGVAADALRIAEQRRIEADEARALAESERLLADAARAEAERERGVAEGEAARRQAVNDFLRWVLRSPDPLIMGRDATLGALLDRAGSEVDERFAEQPETLAGTLMLLAETEYSLGAERHASELLGRAVTILREVAPDSLVLADALRLQAGSADVFDGDPGQPELREARALYERHLGPDHPMVVAAEAMAVRRLAQRGRLEEASRDAAEALRRWGDSDDPDKQLSLAMMSATLAVQEGRWTDARDHWREHLEQLEARGPEGPGREDQLRHQRDRAAAIESMLGVVLRVGDLDEAARLSAESLAFRNEVLGEDHAGNAVPWSNHGTLLRRLGRHTEAEQAYRRALDISRATLTAPHRTLAINLNNLGALLADVGRRDEGLAMLRDGRDMLVELHGPTHPSVARADITLADHAGQQGDHDGAVAGHMQALAVFRQHYGDDHPETIEQALRLAGHAARGNAVDQARDVALAFLGQAHGAEALDHGRIADRAHGVVGQLREQGAEAQARDVADRLAEVEASWAAAGS